MNNFKVGQVEESTPRVSIEFDTSGDMRNVIKRAGKEVQSRWQLYPQDVFIQS